MISVKHRTIIRMDWRIVCVAVICLVITHQVTCGHERKHTDVILIGATGDLAKKYLWQSIYQLYLKHNDENTTFTFYGCGRSKFEDGRELLEIFLHKNVNCDFTPEIKVCEKKKRNFMKMVKYFPLRTDIDFQNFGLQLDMQINNRETIEMGRLIYLSIPPSAYVSMAAKMWNCCYIRTEKSWNRLVLEKPFGSDHSSAVSMAEEIAKNFKEEEIYRVDHYLGKSVVKQILPFRQANKQLLEPLLTREHVARVEVVMKETIGVLGRIDFYDQYGVIRDVMQNHLTELLALVAMDLPDDITDTKNVDKNRVRFLSQVDSVRRNSVLIGQYANYVSQAESEKHNVTMSKFTPTFSAAKISVSNRRWSGVPFLVVSGKHLDERSSFIRVVFKDNDFCIAGCHHHNGSHWRGQKQIIFQIGHGNLPSAGILVSKDLFKPVLSSSLKDLPITADDIAMYGQSLNEFTFLVPADNLPAYITVIEDMYLGRRESFVSTDRLIKLWRIWSPVLSDLDGVLPRLYQPPEDRSLNFKLTTDGLQYLFKDNLNVITDHYYGNTFASLPASYLGRPIFFKSSEELLFHSVAELIFSTITKGLEAQEHINIAFSGGRTPARLFQVLVDTYSSIPWEYIHIWQVDERCVSNQDDDSNFKMIQHYLIQNINIPYFNIHPMQVDIHGRLCSPVDKATAMYEAEIQYHIRDLQFDLILLGLGTDGHTASLFPNKTYERTSLVAMDTVKSRMTLTFPLLNKGRQLIVLATGSKKHGILLDLLDDKKTVSDYPILGVKPAIGNLTWFVDYDAWFGR